MKLLEILAGTILWGMSSAHAAQVSCDLPWIYFDLGANTLIDTDHDTMQVTKYMPGAHDYLQDLKAKGYHLGLLVNVPASWGETQEEKLAKTKSVIASSWADTVPMDWGMFDLGIAFPPTDAERKPAPFLFTQAMTNATVANCDAVYQTTLPAEVPAANRAGMTGIQVGGNFQYDGQYYYPESRLRNRDFTLVH